MKNQTNRRGGGPRFSRRRGAAVLSLAVAMVTLTGGAGAYSTQQLEAWGSECRREQNILIPPTDDGIEWSRPKAYLFDSCMANGGHLPDFHG